MAIAKQDFNRGQVVNPLSTFGDDLQKFGVNLRQQELDRLAAERQASADRRAQEQLDMQKQQYADQAYGAKQEAEPETVRRPAFLFADHVPNNP